MHCEEVSENSRSKGPWGHVLCKVKGKQCSPFPGSEESKGRMMGWDGKVAGCLIMRGCGSCGGQKTMSGQKTVLACFSYWWTTSFLEGRTDCGARCGREGHHRAGGSYCPGQWCCLRPAAALSPVLGFLLS